MIRERRHEWILEQVSVHGSMRVEELAEGIGVTTETIRKDLIAMDQSGKLRRTRGGAMRTALSRFDLPLPEREGMNRPEKGRIARAACTLLRPRDTLFLDASSTVMTMTEFFPDHEATVITNANHVVVSLGNYPNLDLICTGGDYENRSRSYIGPLAETAARRFFMQWLFIGVDGLDPLRGASEVNRGQARLKEQILDMAEQVVVLADHSKLGRKSPFFFAQPQQIHMLITDEGATDAQLSPWRDLGVKIMIAK